MNVFLSDTTAFGLRRDFPARADVRLYDLATLDTGAVDVERFLSPEESARASRLSQLHRRRFELTYSTLRSLLAEHTGVQPTRLVLRPGRYGKPQLLNSGAVAFNLAHSGRWLLIGVAKVEAIGVDLEVVRPVPNAVRLAHNTFGPASARALQSLAPGLRSRAFLAEWTRHEARLKAAGTGLDDTPAHLSNQDRSCTRWWIQDLALPTWLIGAIATSEHLTEVAVRKILPEPARPR